MHPKLQALVDAAVAEERMIRWLIQTGFPWQDKQAFDFRLKRFLREQKKLIKTLSLALACEQALWAAAEVRLGRPPIDNEDIISQADIDLADSMRKTLTSAESDV